MSLEAVLDIVDRAVRDEDFRALLLHDPAKALRGVDLTKSERAMLRGIAGSPYDASPRGLSDLRKMVAASIEYDGSG